ncbi:pickpocket protein 28-like [Culicoides brevitarsis]|uniref:pickpocket protein 28-like n=1 Tax=Culicoides brevitarsis TaxID=469753 RepID=UPI00307B4AEB
MIAGVLQHYKRKIYHPVEKIYWIASLLIVFVASLLPISNFIFKFLANPINVAVDRDYFHFNLTFPSLTLCLHNRLNETAVEHFVQQYAKVAKKRQLEAFLHDLAYFDPNHMEKLAKFTRISTNDYVNILVNVSNHMNAQIITPQNRSYELQPMLTEVGLCYVFNTRIGHLFNPTTTTRMSEESATDQHLYKINFYDAETEGNLLYMGSNFDIFMHGQMELPSVKAVIRTERGQQGSYIKLMFTTHVITSDEDVRNLAIFQRRCRFDDESNLVHFPRHYSPSLCQLDCKLQAYEKHCGCIPFYYHHVTRDRNQCSHNELKCISKITEFIEMQNSECECLASCNDEKLLLQSTNSFYWLREPSLHFDLEKIKTAYRRQVIFGWRELLVASGASAGLFLGISVLSVVEFFYLQIIRRVYLMKRNCWKKT